MELPVLERVDELRQAVLEGPAELDEGTRAAAAAGGPLPDELAEYAARVRSRAYAVTDAQVEALLAAGWSEDAIFELTVAIAVGAGLARLDAGLAALEAAR